MIDSFSVNLFSQAFPGSSFGQFEQAGLLSILPSQAGAGELFL